MKRLFQYITITWKKTIRLFNYEKSMYLDIQKSLIKIGEDISNLNEIASQIDLLIRDYNSAKNEEQKMLKQNEITEAKNKLKTEMFKAIGSLTTIGTQIQ